jgi:hypothetical protein
MHAQRVEDLLLHRQEGRRIIAKRVSLEAEMGANHERGSLGLRSLAVNGRIDVVAES